jgi:hypothetical protein
MDLLKGIMIFAQRLPADKGASEPDRMAAGSADAVKR